MRLAIIWWFTRSVGGIGTRLNNWRKAAIRYGDQCDILVSKCNKSGPQLFKERKWTYGGDTRIWVDGNAPHGERVQETIRWLEDNYDALCFGFVCPHQCKTYPEPYFLPLYLDCKLSKVACVSDGYWAKYKDWADVCLPYANCVVSPLESYAQPVRDSGLIDVKVIPFPFVPQLGKYETRSRRPLVVWPHQWKNIKGIDDFLRAVPLLDKEIDVELYSSGIRYYQLRTTDLWKNAVSTDTFSGYNGHGRAVYKANVDVPEIARAYQRAWFTVNLQGMRTNKAAYKAGSYNNAEVEALYYGACPVLHKSTKGTSIPREVYLFVDSGEEIPGAVHGAIESGFATGEDRRRRAREFVLDTHLASRLYPQFRRCFG